MTFRVGCGHADAVESDGDPDGEVMGAGICAGVPLGIRRSDPSLRLRGRGRTAHVGDAGEMPADPRRPRRLQPVVSWRIRRFDHRGVAVDNDLGNCNKGRRGRGERLFQVVETR